MNRYITLFFAVFFASSIFAQEFSLNNTYAPFKGRKHLAGLDFDIIGGGGIASIFVNGFDRSAFKPAIGGFYQIQANKAWNVRLGINYFQVNDLWNFQAYDNVTRENYTGLEVGSDFSNGILQVSLSLRKFRKVSPFGSFYDFKVGYLSNSGGTFVMANFNGLTTSQRSIIADGLSAFTLGAGIGRNYPISEKYFLGTSVNVDFIGFWRSFRSIISDEIIEEDLPFEDAARAQLNRKFAASATLSLKIELGYAF